MDNATPTDAATENVVVDEIDWKAKAREWEKRAKENKGAADELTALRDSATTAEQRFEARLAEVEKRAEKAELDALRSSIAAAHGISAEDRDLFLVGSDADALTAQATRLAERVAVHKKAGNVAPKEGAATGSGGDDSMRDFARQLFSPTE